MGKVIKMAKKGSDEFFRSIVDGLDDETASIADDAVSSAEYTGWMDTGSYSLNALVSASMFGGIPNNKVTCLRGDPATGKTFFALGLMQSFLAKNPNGGILFVDTEFAVTKQMLAERNIDPSRVIKLEPLTIEDFHIKVSNFLKKYEEHENRPSLMIVLDSLSQLPSSKEVEDTDKGELKGNMGSSAKVIKRVFREIRQRLARLQVPLVFTAHVYSLIGSYVPTKSMSGGSGPFYAADIILDLTKKKDKDGTDVVGNIITVKNIKNRMARENQKVEVKLSYTKGLDRYYGLLDLAEKYDVIKKAGNKYELPDGTKVFGKEINDNPDKVFSDDVMAAVETAARKEFSYGEK